MKEVSATSVVFGCVIWLCFTQQLSQRPRSRVHPN